MRKAGHAALALALALTAGAVAPPDRARAADRADLITPHVVTITETVSDAGFVHPGVGLSAADLRGTQARVRSGQEPWASYFAAMAATGHASAAYRASNSRSAAAPDVPLDPSFTQVGQRNRQTEDSFGALTQALMWTVTGDEVHRRNAVQVLRAWAGMDPARYAYFPDAHIHTGHPLYQFLMAAEIIRATAPLDDGTPGTHQGYDVVWSAQDDARLLANLARPVVETFLHSNTRWMNQHNFGLFGRIATAIYADDTAGYATGVEWFTVNSGYTGYDNGALAPQIPLIRADDPINPYGRDVVQVREMGRDQAHAECDIDNFTGLARMLEVQGTTVDPQAGTVSARPDAVSAYDFLGRRLLHGANAFYGFMMGAPAPWVDERGAGWDGTVAQAYRGRLFNPVNELYHEYADERGVDVAAEAPWLAGLSSRRDGPYFYNGTTLTNFWAPGDKNPEYWVAFPAALAGTLPVPAPNTPDLALDRWGLPLDDRSETRNGFVRAHVSRKGTTVAVGRVMHDGNGANGVLVRADGPATLEILDREDRSGRNPDELPATVLATIPVPDTQGRWRYVSYPEAGTYAHFLRLTGAGGTTVDLGHLRLQAQATLTPPRFEQPGDHRYLTYGRRASIDSAAIDSAGPVTYRASGLPRGAALDAATGQLTWTPGLLGIGRHRVQVVADDGESVTARTLTLVVSLGRRATIDAAVADGVRRDTVYTTATREPFDAALAAARRSSDAEFDAALAALTASIRALAPLRPRLPDGTLNYLDGVAKPTVIDAAALRNLADDDYHTAAGDLRVASFTLDFGTRYRVAADAFGLRARFGFGNRLQGTNVYGSADGITWDLLTVRETVNANDWQTIPVNPALAGRQYRYLKLQVDHPGVPTDPAYPGIWSFAGLRIHGQRAEVPGTVTDVSVASPDAEAGRVTAGDRITVTFSGPAPISGVAVSAGGTALTASSPDGRSWTATGVLGEVTGGRRLDVTIDHTTAAGTAAARVHGTTDGTALYASDARHPIDLGAARVLDPADAPHEARMRDGNAATFSDLGGDFALTWDLGDGAAVRLDRADLLVRQDNTGLVRVPGLVLHGSADLRSWTPLTGPAAKTPAWQNLPSTGTGRYRYLRLSNDTYLNVAELRLFGG